MNNTAPNVIVIPAKVETPQEQEKKRHLRVAAYCRVSTDSEEQLSSYENQLTYYTEKIMKEPGWTMAGVFADEGITGTSTCKRKEFLRMIRQCRQGKIDMILAKSVSRFARNTVDTSTSPGNCGAWASQSSSRNRTSTPSTGERVPDHPARGLRPGREREHQQPGALGQAPGHEIWPCHHAVQAAPGL